MDSAYNGKFERYSPRLQNYTILRKRNFRYNCKKYLRSYAETSTVHGVRYLEENRSKFEKFFWAATIFLSFCCCIYMMSRIWNKYNNSPIVINFGAKQLTIKHIPLPAVTICSSSKIDGQKIDPDYVLFFENQTNENKEAVNFVKYICNFRLAEPCNLTENFYEIIKDIQYNYISKFVQCQVLGFDWNCSQLFGPVFTQQGLCYSFNIQKNIYLFRDNIQPFKDYYESRIDDFWDVEEGYKTSAGNELPWRSYGAGAQKFGLMIRITTPKASITEVCEDVPGYRVAVHTPYEIPPIEKNSFVLPFSKSVTAEISATYINTDKEVANYPVSKRKCYFNRERKLRYFKIYTQQFCKLECYTYILVKKCGCADFYMPREEGTRLCGSYDLKCVYSGFGNESFFKLYLEEECDCKPLCISLKYEASIIQSPLKPNLEKADDASVEESELIVYFKDEDVLTLERKELYGITDLISSFGGLLGLFTGFTMISLVELIYFLTLRIIGNRRLYDQWAGPD